MTDTNQLHACRRCRSRKQKCDKSVPRCAGCEKSNAECIFVCPSTGEEYTRTAIAELEQLELHLRQTATEPSRQRAESPPSEQDAPPPANDSYIGENVLEQIFSNPRFQPQLVKHLLARPRIQQPEEVPAAFPSEETARFLFTTYLGESHVQKPFLMEDDVLALLARIYSHAHETENTAQDLFNFYLICATSAVPLRRRGHINEHPYGFFLAARALADRVALVAGIEAVQSLLLLARFGVYFHTGASLWEIGRVCISICVSLELHLNPLRPLPAIEEQKRRRVFWESYVLDRHSSTILGRPFAIADTDIRVDLPANIPDAELAGAYPGALDINAEPATYMASPMTVFNCFVRLRQITSRIHTTFLSRLKEPTAKTSTVDRFSELGSLYGTFQDLSQELSDWRKTTPSFLQPESLYHRPQWYEFLYQKEKLFLVRAMVNASSLNNGKPPKDLSRICCECAAAVISLYAEMYWARQINCTRHYFQILLTAGLMLAYFSTSSRKQAVSQQGSTVHTLASCSKILHGLGAEMFDARPYATVFDLICETAIPGWKSQTSSQPDLNNQEMTLPTLSRNGQDLLDFGYQHNNRVDPNVPVFGLDDFAYPESLPSDWSYSPGQMFADVEAYVNQFATGDFATDTLLDPSSWNMASEFSYYPG